jgi:tetratricopeptide (TPR) repeat protein
VWEAYPGEIFTVTLTNGEWLWIAEKGGWLFEQHAMMFDDAVDQLTSRLKTEQSADNYFLRGLAHVAHTEYDKAIEDFTKGLEFDPENAGILTNRGRTWYRKQNYKQAIADFDGALRVNPKHFMAWNNRGLAHLALGNLDQAKKDLTSALKHNRKFVEAYNNRGVVNGRKGDLRAAIRDYTSALEIDSTSFDALTNRSFAHRQLGEFRQAVADLTTAIRLSPQDYRPVNDLAWLLATVSDKATRNPPKAVQLATAACQMTSYDNWNTLDTLAAAHAAAGNFREAQQWAGRAIQKAPESEKNELQRHLELFSNGKSISE